MTTDVLFEVKDGIATLTLNRPRKMNAWDTPMRGEVMAALKATHAATLDMAKAGPLVKAKLTP